MKTDAIKRKEYNAAKRAYLDAGNNLSRTGHGKLAYAKARDAYHKAGNALGK